VWCESALIFILVKLNSFSKKNRSFLKKLCFSIASLEIVWYNYSIGYEGVVFK